MECGVFLQIWSQMIRNCSNFIMGTWCMFPEICTFVFSFLCIVRPSCTHLQVQSSTSATLSWKLPHLAEYFSLQSFTIVWKDSSDTWKCLPATVDCHKRQFDISSADIETTDRVVHVAVQADYQGNSIRSDEHQFDLAPEGNSQLYMLW